MMNYYRRVDGTICKAIQFKGRAENDENVFNVLDILTKASLLPLWTSVEVTDEWVENEAGDDYEQVVIPEHIKIGAGNDELQLGDYVIERDGDTYFMGGDLFESIWSPTYSDNMDDWQWHINKRLPYAKIAGYWENKLNPDAVSTDGGVTFFLLSEVPRYQVHGTIYPSVKTNVQGEIEPPELKAIADICKHCGRPVVNFNENQEVFKGFKHTAGKQRGLIRCWPEDTGQPYGLNATPRSYSV
jgi:hypothetical protein